jgi:hypothetical protein
MPGDSDHNHHQENEYRQRKGHNDMAGDRKGPDGRKQPKWHHSVQIRKQHEKEQGKDKGEEFQSVGAAGRPDHVRHEKVAHFGDRLDARGNKPARRCSQCQEDGRRARDDTHPERGIGE